MHDAEDRYVLFDGYVRRRAREMGMKGIATRDGDGQERPAYSDLQVQEGVPQRDRKARARKKTARKQAAASRRTNRRS